MIFFRSVHNPNETDNETEVVVDKLNILLFWNIMKARCLVFDLDGTYYLHRIIL